MTEADGTDIQIELFIPYRYVAKIKKGMAVEIEFEGYEAGRYGYIKRKIESCNDSVRVVNETNGFVTKATPDGRNLPYRLWKNMKGTAFILISNESIGSRFFSE